VSNEKNISGETIYSIIITKGLKKNIIISNHKRKSFKFYELITIFNNFGIKVVQHKKTLVSELIDFYYMTIS
jgi:hypothetical protein